MADKNCVRKTHREIRRNISDQDRQVFSDAISKSIIDSDWYKNAKTVFLYLPTKYEVDLEKVLLDAIDSGKKVCVPMCIGDGEMIAVTPRSFDDLNENSLGIREPKQDGNHEVCEYDMDIIFVPGVAFDAQGNRVGQGGGYYDRYLEKCSKDILKVGVCFESQIKSKIEADEWDLPMDVIITQERAILVR